MSQDFAPIVNANRLGTNIPILNDRANSNRSCFSGSAYPGTPVAGQLFFNTTDLTLEEWDGSVWNLIAAKNNSTTTSPGVGDDSNDGYSIRSIWINTTLDEAFICLDASVGAAVWLPVVKLDKANKWGKTQSAEIETLTDEATMAWDGERQWLVVTLTANRTLSNMTDVQLGATYRLMVIQGGAGGFGITYGTNYKFAGGTDPDHTGRATGEYDIVSFDAWEAAKLVGSSLSNPS